MNAFNKQLWRLSVAIAAQLAVRRDRTLELPTGSWDRAVTHPANSPRPSGTDEETFERVFARADWALMFILARGGDCYARLRYHVGPGVDLELAVEIDYSRPFNETEFYLCTKST
jgi:hypothetical protein